MPNIPYDDDYANLEKIIGGMTPTQILAYGDVLSFFKEEFNNQLIEMWTRDNDDTYIREMRDTELNTWFERDRAHVELVDAYTGTTLAEWWDEAVQEAADDGWLELGKGEDALHQSAFDYYKQRHEAGNAIPFEHHPTEADPDPCDVERHEGRE